jgi:hypothetical protein
MKVVRPQEYTFEEPRKNICLEISTIFGDLRNVNYFFRCCIEGRATFSARAVALVSFG